MGVATTLIGCLPTYQQIGIAAPVLLALLRLIQVGWSSLAWRYWHLHALCAGAATHGAPGPQSTPLTVCARPAPMKEHTPPVGCLYPMLPSTVARANNRASPWVSARTLLVCSPAACARCQRHQPPTPMPAD
jgi:hypothetical protein